MEKIKLLGLKPAATIAMLTAGYSSAQACSALALMNTAPAELLHPLTYAALQPYGAMHISLLALQRHCGYRPKKRW
tara:strand:+ start:775878 stop:776105 length:228 start_codon:yes stop_codon:yes gene_type:complete